jgi:catechol 2,3-dioxygenase-like lactoylglutathione lyase family enzyme
MFDHVSIRAADREATERFYDTVLATLGMSRRLNTEAVVAWGEFLLAAGDQLTRRLHVGFGARDRATVDAFHRAGVDAGYRSDGEPGPRPEYGPDYYGGFLLDPDGNSIEAVHHDTVESRVDHLWIRVADVAAARDFYATIAPYSGFELKADMPERAQFQGPGASFSVVAAEPGQTTEHLHLAFTAGENATVDAFHAAATAAGHRDNGGPGERRYHAGYYAAFVFDPDGNNIEVVCHNR